jgi:hypothetical protein
LEGIKDKMGYIISAGTNVGGLGNVQSINVDLSPQIQRLYALGSSEPFEKIIIHQSRLSATCYGGSGPSFAINAPGSNCAEANTLGVSVSAAGCGGGGAGVSDAWFVTSYSYNKDPQGWGMVTWNMVTRPVPSEGSQPRMLSGIAEGQASSGGASVGVSFSSTTVDGSSISVQAGNPGIGRANDVQFGEVSSVSAAGTTGRADGTTGTASVSIPYAPVYGI